jgi:hypothetical protein
MLVGQMSFKDFTCGHAKNPAADFDAILRVARLTNLGTIINRGVVELGD